MRVINLTVLVIAIGFISGCSPATHTFNNSSDWLPAEFNPRTDYLVIDNAGFPQNQISKMIRFMKEKYPYKYSFVPSLMLTEQVADPKIYRFILLNSAGVVTIPSMSVPAGSFDFHFYDRLTKTKYPDTKRGSSSPFITFEAIINTILEKYP
jgi:hypothetical protein